MLGDQARLGWASAYLSLAGRIDEAAEIAARADPPQAASSEAHYRRALMLAEELGMRPLVAHTHRGLGRQYQRIGEPQQANEHVAIARAMYDDMGMTFWLERAKLAARAAG